MKQCKVDGCDYPVFGKGYCRYHQYLRLDKVTKPLKSSKPISHTSAKRRSQLNEYNRLKAEAVQEARMKGPIRCFADNSVIDGIPDWHHIEGRIEEKLLDKSKLVFIKRQNHMDIHNLPYSILSKRPWYKTYMANLKMYYPKAYEIEDAKRSVYEDDAANL